MQCRQSHFHSAGPPSPASACTASIPMSSDVSRRQNIESGPSARTSSSPRTAKYPPPSMHNPHAHQPLHLPFRTRPPPKLDQQPEHARERMLVRLADAHQLVALGVDLERRLEHLLHQLRRVEDDWRRRREAGVAAHRPVPPVALVEPANARRAEDVDHEGTPHAAQTPKVLADDLEPSDHARPGGVHVLEHLVGELQQQGHRHGARARDPLCPGAAVVLCHGVDAVAGRRRRDRNPASCERRRTGDARQHMASRGPGPRGGRARRPRGWASKAQPARTAGVVGHQVGAGGLVDALGGLRVD